MNRRVRKYAIGTLLVTVLAASSVKGQVNPATAFYWENPYYINPAFVHTDASAYFFLSARKQWMALSGSPVTFFGTATFYSERYRMQTGVKILHDKIGYVGSSDLSLSYAYSLELRNGALNMGLALSYQLQAVDREKMAIEEENDPVLASLADTKKEWNTGVGAEYIAGRSLRAGISAQNMLSFFKKGRNIFGGTNYLYGRYRTRILGRLYQPTAYRTTASPTTYDMEWGICLRQYENDFQVDGVVSFYLNHHTQREKFQVSILGRSIGEIGVLAGVKLLSEVKVLCAYDYNFRAWQGNSRGTFEVIVSYPLLPKKCVADGF